MDCFIINLNSILKVTLSSKEHLIPPRSHLTRKTVTYIMYFVTAGTLGLFLNGERTELSKGDVCIFNKGDTQAPAACTDCEYFYLHFECDIEPAVLSPEELFDAIAEKNRAFAETAFLDYGRYDRMSAMLPAHFHIEDGEVFEYLVNEFRKLRLNVWDVGIEKRLELCSGATALLLKLERIWSNSYATRTKDGYLRNLSLVKRIADFVEKNYDSSFGSEQIEKMFAVSYDHANRLFSKQMGMGIVAYRNHLRVEKAKILLVTTDKSIEEISDDVGFSDKYYFSRFFKRIVGVSPKHFKRGEYFAI
ncbi:MAG: AraC family transcriptional regulator [Ruminococcaceae bacterium]|nr:AraC family transcriptional regulator [Oscillospiraceae bacterium]